MLAATFISRALSELPPELRAPQYRWTVATGFLIGYALVRVLDQWASAVGIHA